MTIFEFLFLPERQVLLTVHFLLMAAQMALLFTWLRDKRRFGGGLLLALHFLFELGTFYLMVQEILSNPHAPDGEEISVSVWPAFGSLSVYMLIAYEVFTVIVLLLEILDLIRYRKTHPTSRSIKETIDLLPVGIAFLRADGSAALHNLVMDELLWKTDEDRFQTGRSLLNRIVEEQSPDFEKLHDSSHTIRLQSAQGTETVWQTAFEKADIEGERFVQLTASDITRQSKITEELEDKNAKLRDLHMRLDIYNKQAERMIIAQELLSARMAVHNEIGNVLLESRHYLNDPGSFDEEMLLLALKQINTYLLREYEEDDSESDLLADTLDMANAIGVEVAIAGVIPQADPRRSILAAAIMECATNTVKHAEGNALLVEILKTDEGIAFLLSGNGNPPQDEIRETGGLKSLRQLVEQEGGKLEIQRLPEFSVTIYLSGR